LSLNRRWDLSLCPHIHNNSKTAWIGTGDANLVRKNRADAFIGYFNNLFPQVRTFVLPHHGSKYNFKGSFLNEGLKDIFWVAAAAEANQFGHPDPILMKSLTYRGTSLQVSEREGTAFHETFLYKIL
jgi:beta-lactamase superfamily II metal-dependent hydrolase